MVGLAAVFFPVLLMMFALSMERVEARLRRQADRDQELTGGLEEVDATVAAPPHPTDRLGHQMYSGADAAAPAPRRANPPVRIDAEVNRARPGAT